MVLYVVITPVRMLLNIPQCLSPLSGSYPREPLFFFDLNSDDRSVFADPNPFSGNLWPYLAGIFLAPTFLLDPLRITLISFPYLPPYL
ncbi:MAG: hypothetical protein KAR07_04605 [Spirochaetes bacterium]|nr:hypothetical protein [Spirochaetota bacterium]